MTKTTKIHNSIQLLAPRPYLKVLSRFIHQSIDSRKRCHVNKPLAWSAHLLSKNFWEVVGVKFYSTVRSNFFYWQFKKLTVYWYMMYRHVCLTYGKPISVTVCKLRVYPYLSQTSNSRIPSNLANKILEYRLAWCSTTE